MVSAQQAKLQHSVTKAQASVSMFEELLAVEKLPIDKANLKLLLTRSKVVAQYHENEMEKYELTRAGGLIDRLKQQAEHPLPLPIAPRTTMLRPGMSGSSRPLGSPSNTPQRSSAVISLEQAEARKAQLEEEIDRFRGEEPEWLETIGPAIEWFREKYGLESDNQPQSPKQRVEQFQKLAGELWRKAPRTGKKVSLAGLAWIAAGLDKAGFVPPADFLEETCSHQVETHKTPINTWSALVASEDKDLIRGMRRLFYHCK